MHEVLGAQVNQPQVCSKYQPGSCLNMTLDMTLDVLLYLLRVNLAALCRTVSSLSMLLWV